MKFAIVIEKSGNGYSAFIPDIPGCVAVGETIKETQQLIREAIQIHVAAMREDGLAIPVPTALAEYVTVTI